MPEMRSYYSSHVDAAGYDPQTQELRVTWRSGATTVYAGVPQDLAREVLAAPSIGEALHLGVRGRYPHRTVKPEFFDGK